MKRLKRSLSIAAFAILAAGCSSHSAVPSPTNPSAAAPQVVQKQPLPAPGWTWVHLPSVNGFAPNPIALVSDGKSKMWFVESAGRIGYVSMSQHVQTYPLNIVPFGLALGPDGNLWVTGAKLSFTESVIAKVTPAGVETDYVITGGGTNPNAGIVVGADGALWFTVIATVPALGRITTSGMYTLYPLHVNELPMSIAAGSDGNLWVANAANGGGIDKVTAAGVETSYPTSPTAQRIISGPDGALYFYGGNWFGRITTSGVVNFYGTYNFFDMSNGPRGLVWAGDLYTLDPVSDTITKVSEFPRSTDVTAVAAGPDRNLWMATTHLIGTYIRLTMTVTPSSLTIAAPGETGNLTTTETNYHSTWTATTSAKSIATVMQTSSGSFTVTGVAAGSCKVTIKDTSGNSVVVPVTVQ